MVLVDTSVWIRFLSAREPFRSELERLLGLNEVVGHDFVFGELLIGDRGGRKKLLADYAKMSRALTIPHHEVVDFVQARHIHGRGVGWIDVHLLASALVGSFSIYTADPRFAALADELGILYGEPVQ